MASGFAGQSIRVVGEADGSVAAEANVELVLVDLSNSPDRRKVLRQLPQTLSAAINRLERGPERDPPLSL